MKITFLTVGKTTNAHLIKLQEEYQNRLKFYIPFETIIIPELKNTKNLSVQEQKEKEADLILKAIETTDEVILLDEKGKQYTSVGFSEFISKKMLASHKRMIFVVGGPYGFSERVYQRANGKISLSAMTFSHQMIRLIFTEQLYRAMTILKGEPYHHE
jgi:23S rRNA (pseudouridine1915-N3)-methyltransferase